MNSAPYDHSSTTGCSLVLQPRPIMPQCFNSCCMECWLQLYVSFTSCLILCFFFDVVFFSWVLHNWANTISTGLFRHMKAWRLWWTPSHSFISLLYFSFFGWNYASALINGRHLHSFSDFSLVLSAVVRTGSNFREKWGNIVEATKKIVLVQISNRNQK